MKNRWMLLALLTGGLTMAMACGDLEGEDCDPAESDTCVCTDSETDAECDPETYDGEGECTCTDSAANNEENNSTANNSTANNSTANNSTANNSNNTDPGVAYRFVLLEDNTDPVAGEFPGNDVDAISVIKAGGGEVFATRVVDANIADPNGNNSATDPNQMIGAPDANCQAQSGKFTALGGQAAGGYAIVEFGTTGVDVTIENGDSIKIYELGATLCGMFDDDAGTVGVSASSDLGSFITIGSTGTGQYTIPVAGLP
jgi:hypothetical protein